MTIFIDPLEQILMDFYLACWAANEEGKTEIINYSEWTAKIKALYDCACGEPLRENIGHGKYQCMNHETGKGVLRAGNDELKDFGRVKEDFLK